MWHRSVVKCGKKRKRKRNKSRDFAELLHAIIATTLIDTGAAFFPRILVIPRGHALMKQERPRRPHWRDRYCVSDYIFLLGTRHLPLGDTRHHTLEGGRGVIMTTVAEASRRNKKNRRMDAEGDEKIISLKEIRVKIRNPNTWTAVIAPSP